MPRHMQSGSYPGVCLLTLIIVMVGGHVVCQESSGLDYSPSNGLKAITMRVLTVCCGNMLKKIQTQ